MLRCELRLHQDQIAFRGPRAESAGQVLTGFVIFHTLTHLDKAFFRLRLLEELEVAELAVRKWQKVFRSRITKTRVSVAEHFQPMPVSDGAVITSTLKSPLDFFQCPFQFPLPGDLTESIEGLPELRLQYRLEVTVCISGAPIARAYQRLRIIRVAATDAVELHHAEIVDRIWHDKLEYCLSLPQKVVSFGGVVHLNMYATVLLVGLRLERVTVKLTENREIRTRCHSGHTLQSRFRRVFAKVHLNKPSHNLPTADKTVTSDPPSWTLSVPLPLPQRLQECAQDVNFDLIKVTHAVKVLMVLKNADGHKSEIRVELPVAVCISPNTKFDQEGVLITSRSSQNSESQRASFAAPPNYGLHIFDPCLSSYPSPGVDY